MGELDKKIRELGKNNGMAEEFDVSKINMFQYLIIAFAVKRGSRHNESCMLRYLLP